MLLMLLIVLKVLGWLSVMCSVLKLFMLSLVIVCVCWVVIVWKCRLM